MTEALDKAEAALDAESEWEGQIRAVSFEDGVDHGPACGLEDCECPDHDDPPRPEGTYITVRLDGKFDAAGPWRVRVTRLPAPITKEGS